MKHPKFVILYLAIFISIPAQAVMDNNKHIKRLGVQGNHAYFDFVEDMSLNCKWGAIYFNISTDFGKAAYSNILAAKSAGKKLSRIDYTQAADGETCTLSLVEVTE